MWTNFQTRSYQCYKYAERENRPIYEEKSKEGLSLGFLVVTRINLREGHAIVTLTVMNRQMDVSADVRRTMQRHREVNTCAKLPTSDRRKPFYGETSKGKGRHY